MDTDIRVGDKTDEGGNTCRFCASKFHHTDQTVDVCRQCYLEGKPLAEDFKVTLESLSEVNSNAQMMNTGGGCFVVMVPVAEPSADGDGWFDRYVMLTDANGWELPEGDNPDIRWCVGYYDNRPSVTDDCDNMVEGLGFDKPEDGLTMAEVKEYIWARTAIEALKDDFKAGRLVLDDWDETFSGLHLRCDANAYVEGPFLWGLEHGETDFETVNRVVALIEARLGEVRQ